MRKSNWKIKVLVLAAFVLGFAAAILVAVFLPERYEIYKGLLSFGSFALVVIAVVFIGAKVFKIGEE